MNKTIALSMAVACLAGVAAAQDDGVHWFGDYKEALEEARRTQKPIFLEFRCEA